MTTTPETIAELKRLLDVVDSRNVLLPNREQWDEFALACRLALPSLLSDLDASQKALVEIRELAENSNKPTYLIEVIASTARHALAATEGK